MGIMDINKVGEKQLFDVMHTLPPQAASAIESFCLSYKNAVGSQEAFSLALPSLISYLEQIKKNFDTPFVFSHYHAQERAPFDFFHMARDIINPLIEKEASTVTGIDNLKAIDEALARKENVILLSNHQTEPDPQIISLQVEPYSRKLSQEMISIAGHRVTEDPLAIPFSRGCNLICIYSKKYIEHPPEEKAEKLLHNARSLSKLEELLQTGGSAFYVAPSGGRDRWDAEGNVSIAPFDPQSVELFRLLAKKAGRPTHFHLLTLSTIHLLPPPQGINIELGEQRIASRAPVHLHFSQEISFEGLSSLTDKIQVRVERAQKLTQMIKETYKSFFTKDLYGSAVTGR